MASSVPERWWKWKELSEELAVYIVLLVIVNNFISSFKIFPGHKKKATFCRQKSGRKRKNLPRRQGAPFIIPADIGQKGNGRKRHIVINRRRHIIPSKRLLLRTLQHQTAITPLPSFCFKSKVPGHVPWTKSHDMGSRKVAVMRRLKIHCSMDQQFESTEQVWFLDRNNWKETVATQQQCHWIAMVGQGMWQFRNKKNITIESERFLWRKWTG